MAAILARLDAIQDQVSHVQIPLSYAEHLYHLRAHIGFVRQLVTEGPTGPDPSTVGVLKFHV